MEIIIAIIYIILFIIMMLFVFSVGMLKKFVPKREILLILFAGFFIGAIGGAFFIEPIYEDLPSLVSLVEKNIPGNEETLYLDLSSSIDINELEENLSKTEGFISFDEYSVTIPLWSFNEKEQSYFEEIVGNIDSNYKNYTVNSSGNIEIELEDNYSSSKALKSFSDWYKLVYGGTISYAQVHAKLIIQSNSLDTFEKELLERGIVASKIEGPVQDSVDDTNESMLSNTEFTVASGIFGVIIAVFGIYFDNVAVAIRRFRKFIKEKRNR